MLQDVTWVTVWRFINYEVCTTFVWKWIRRGRIPHRRDERIEKRKEYRTPENNVPFLGTRELYRLIGWWRNSLLSSSLTFLFTIFLCSSQYSSTFLASTLSRRFKTEKRRKGRGKEGVEKNGIVRKEKGSTISPRNLWIAYGRGRAPCAVSCWHDVLSCLKEYQ